MLALFFLTAPLATQLDTFVEQARVEYEVPGAAVALIKDGEVLFSKGYGVRTVGEPAKVDGETIFQLASLAKTFAAATVALQVQEGKMGWDDPLIDHLPGFAMSDAYPSRWATARDLLAHRSSLPPFRGDLLGDLGYTREDVLQRVRFLDPIYTFRERAGYSNVGYFIAGQLAARLAGESWEELARMALFSPLKMKRTGFEEQLQDPNASSNHTLVDGKPEVTPPYTSALFAAAGGVTSTSSDMALWMKSLLEGALLKKETIAEMFRPSMVAEIEFSEAAPIDEMSGFAYGMGWGSYHYGGQMVVEKGGGLPGVRTLCTLVPEEGIGIVILANLGLTLFPEAVRAKFLELFVAPSGRDLSAEIAAKQPLLLAMKEGPPPIANPIDPSAPLSAIAGAYTSDLYGDFIVQGETLLAGPAGYLGHLTPYSAESYILRWDENPTGWQEVTFSIGPDGKATGFRTESLGSFRRKE